MLDSFPGAPRAFLLYMHMQFRDNGLMRSFLIAIVAVAVLPAAPASDYTSAKAKIKSIELDRLPAGATVFFTPAELNAFAREEVTKVAPEGVRNPRLELRQGAATGYADVDFAKLKESTSGGELNWLLARMLSGERPVRVDARITSSNGRAQVDVERVDIGGVSITGSALEYLIQHFLWAYYPEAAVNKPFDLAHRMRKIEVRPSGATVTIGN
jgi:hypothetical protein